MKMAPSLTDPVSGLSADGSRALDVGPGGRHVVIPPQLGQEVLDQINEDQIPAGHHQVAQSHDSPLKYSHSQHHDAATGNSTTSQVNMGLKGETYLSDSQSGGGELGEQTAEDGGVEIHQQTSLSAKRQKTRQLVLVYLI